VSPDANSTPAFAASVGALTARSGWPATSPDPTSPSRSSTAASSITTDPTNASWQEFFDTYWRLIYTVATKAGLSDAEAQDVVQETVISVANNVGEYLAKHRVGVQLAAEARQIEERLSQPRHNQSRKGSTER
jgi:hypothetical protein